MIWIKRTVSLHGPATLSVSLPSKWARLYAISKGDELEVSESGDSLIISPSLIKKESSVSLNTKGKNPKLIEWYLSVYYREGFDEIIVFYDKAEHLRVVRNHMKNTMIGFVIVDQSEKRMVLKEISRDLKDEFVSICKRTFSVTLNLARDVHLGFSGKKNHNRLKDSLSLEVINNEYTNFCQRYINKHYCEKHASFHYIICWVLEKIADCYRNIIVQLISDKTLISSEVKILVGKSAAIMEKFDKVIQKYSDESIVELYDLCDSVLKDNITLNNLSTSEFIISHEALCVAEHVKNLIPATIAVRSS